MAEIINLNDYRPFQSISSRARANEDVRLTEGEVRELEALFRKRPMTSLATDIAHIEANNGPIDLSHFDKVSIPPVFTPTLSHKDQIRRVRQLRMMVERTAELLREYLDAYKDTSHHV